MNILTNVLMSTSNPPLSSLLTNPGMTLEASSPGNDLGIRSGDPPVDDHEPNTNLTIKHVESCNSTVTTLEPFDTPRISVKGDECILFIHSMPVSVSCEMMTDEFKVFGNISKIHLKLDHTFQTYQVYLVYSNHQQAMEAHN